MRQDNPSLADKFIAVMAEIDRMDANLSKDAPERYAVWNIKQSAYSHLADAIQSAFRDVDACTAFREAIAKAEKNAS